jgi:FtsZ-binding cell division protein ZapB
LRDSFRAIVEEQDLTTEAGQRTYAALIGVSGAFAELTPVLGAVADAIDANLAKMQDSAAELAVELLQAQGDMAGAASAQRALDTAGYSDLAVAQYDANTATRALIDELNAQAAAADQLAASQAQLAATNKQWQDQLDVLTGAQTERSLALRDATDDSTRALMQQVYAQEDMKSAAESASASMAQLAATNKQWQDQLDVLTGAQTERSLALRDATDDSTRALMLQVYAQQDAKTAQEAYTRSLESAQTRYAAAATAMDSAQNAVDAVLKKATAAYLGAQDRVASAQKRIADIQTSAIRATKQAALESAQQMRELGKSLREFVDGKTLTPDQSFASMLTKALQGDQDAMQGLAGAASAASDNAALYASTGTEARLAQARIMTDVMRAAALGEGTVLPTVNVPDEMLAAQLELVAAQKGASEALRVANTIGAATSQSVTDLVAEYTAAMDILVGAQTELDLSRQLLEAIKVNTAATTAGVDKLGDALTIELTASATSEITKLIRVIGDGSGLEPDLKQLALALSSTISKTIMVIGDSTGITETQKQLALMTMDSVIKTINMVVASNMLSSEQKQLALMTTDSVIKTINMVVASNMLSSEQKQLALMTMDSATKTINMAVVSNMLFPEQKQLALMTTDSVIKTINMAVVSNTLSYEQKQLALLTTGNITKSLNTTIGTQWLYGSDLLLALQATSSVTKIFNAAVGSQDPAAIALAAAVSSTVVKTISASGGTLTADQRSILAAAAGSSTLAVSVTNMGTVTFQPDNALNSIFNNISASNNLLAQISLQQLVLFSGVDWQISPTAAYGATRTNLTQTATYSSSLYHLSAQTDYQAAMRGYLQIISSRVDTGVRVKFDRGTSTGGSGGLVFAQGGAFTNGIVSRPTYFDTAQMGESGPEAIMPLTNIGGSLGVRFAGNSANDALVAEIRALRAEVQGLRAEARATATATVKTAKILGRVTQDGESITTTVLAA